MFYKTVVRVFFLVFVAFVFLAPDFFRLAFCFFLLLWFLASMLFFFP